MATDCEDSDVRSVLLRIAGEAAIGGESRRYCEAISDGDTRCSASAWQG